MPLRVRGGLVVGWIVLVSACMETRRSLGEDCLKNDDCLSQVCSQLRCATRPPTVDVRITAGDATATPFPDAAPSSEADAADDGADQPESSWADVSVDGDGSGE